MTDIVEHIGGSLIQHGGENDRIYLMKLHPPDLPELVLKLDMLAAEHGYGQIFARVPAPLAAGFLRAKYVVEGRIPRFYNNATEALFLKKYFSAERQHRYPRDEIRRVIDLAHAKQGTPPRPLPTGFVLRAADEADAPAIAQIYREVFASYPFPIHEPDYLIETMRSHVCYFAAETAGQIAAVASAEMDLDGCAAEMTDFATTKEHTGHGLSQHLLRFMGTAMAARGITMLYTIARAHSVAMNCTFARCGYTFAGTLINNTQISGRIESMNLWYRSNS